MAEDRETPEHTDPGTPKITIVGGTEHPTGAKIRNKGKHSRSAPDPETGLTEKQEAFAQAIMAGLNYSDAYRASYNVEGVSAPTIWSMSCRVAADPKVQARLIGLKAQKEAERRMQAVSRTDFVLGGLTELASDKSVPHAVRVRALELMGKTVALFTDRVETEDMTDRSADEIEQQIKARLGLG